VFEIFPWNAQLETGISLVDEQHRRLIDLINRLAQQHARNPTAAEVKNILTELLDYADYHFKSEEGVWKSSLEGTDLLAHHAALHHDFFQRIDSLHSSDVPHKDALTKLLPFFVQWLAMHILDEDKRMAFALRCVQSGLSPVEAQKQAKALNTRAAAVLIQALLHLNQALANQTLTLVQEQTARQIIEANLQTSEKRWKALLAADDSVRQAGSTTERRLRTIVHYLPAGVIVIEMRSQRIVFGNPWFCQMLGYSEDELSQLRPTDLHPAEAHAEASSEFQQMATGAPTASLTLPVQRKNGSIFMASIDRVPLDFENLPSALAVFTDVTERERAREALDAERARLQNAIDAAQAGTWEWDMTGRQVYCSTRIADMLGQATPARSDVSIDDFLALMHPQDVSHARYQLVRHLKHELPSFEVEVRLHHHQGHWVWWRNFGRVIQHNTQGKATLMAGISIDITQQKTQQAQIDHLRHNDPLTGLPNRRTFVDRLTLAMGECSPTTSHLAVAYIDLDGLTSINVTHGRDVGSEVVLEVSRRLARMFSEQQFIGHIGGDEFALVLTHLHGNNAYVSYLERMLLAVAKPINLEGCTLQITASIGVTRYPQHDAVDAEQLLRQADQAMYLAKLDGKNRYRLFDPATDESTRERLARIDEIRQGLLNQEFVLYYQPKVKLQSGEVVGFEALIRWNHPQRGLLAPAAFIPLLDQHELAVTLGDWVIENALIQLAIWQAQDLNTSVSVNIDAMQLHDAGFFNRLQRQLRRQPSVQPQQIEFEILETGALENIAYVSYLIGQLKQLGIECSLDDFGTGYSSLNFLKRLDALTIKIDQSFVHGMLDDPEDAAIVNSVLALASNFNRATLAEGIETEDHGVALIEFGCQLGQGYAIARPMPGAEVPAWLSQWQVPTSWVNSNPATAVDVGALLAEVEHRAWLKQLHDFARHKVPLSTTPQPHNCHFGQWLNKRATRKRYGELPDMATVELIHQTVHQQADRLVHRLCDQPQWDATTELKLIDQLSAEMLLKLRQLRQSEPDADWTDSMASQL